MTPEAASLIQTIAGLASVAVSLTAVALALRVESRTERRFQNQLELTQRVAAATAKPLLGIVTAEFVDLKAIRLVNYGVGTAVIRNATVAKAGRSERSAAYLFEFEVPVVWDNYWTFSEGTSYLRAGESLTLIELSTDNYLAKKYGADLAGKVPASWQ